MRRYIYGPDWEACLLSPEEEVVQSHSAITLADQARKACLKERYLVEVVAGPSELAVWLPLPYIETFNLHPCSYSKDCSVLMGAFRGKAPDILLGCNLSYAKQPSLKFVRERGRRCTCHVVLGAQLLSKSVSRTKSANASDQTSARWLCQSFKSEGPSSQDWNSSGSIYPVYIYISYIY